MAIGRCKVCDAKDVEVKVCAECGEPFCDACAADSDESLCEWCAVTPEELDAAAGQESEGTP